MQDLLSLVSKIRRSESYSDCIEFTTEAIDGEYSSSVDLIVLKEFCCFFDSSVELLASLTFF